MRGHFLSDGSNQIDGFWRRSVLDGGSLPRSSGRKVIGRPLSDRMGRLGDKVLLLCSVQFGVEIKTARSVHVGFNLHYS